MRHSLNFALLERKASNTTAATVRAVISVDFLVEGQSLLHRLVKQDGGHGDFMGCFVRSLSEQNYKKRELLLSGAPAETDEGRVLLYVCPECGDIRCGAYAARVRLQPGAVEWFDFAYENGYEPGRPILEVGPFTFDAANYVQVITRAGAA